MNNFFSNLFKFKKAIPDYILVERQINPELIVSGIRVTSGPLSGMVVTTSPSVSFKEVDGEIKLNFEYVVQVPPTDKEALSNDALVEKTVGDIILDLIEKNHTNANREPDSECTEQGPGIRQES